MPTGRMVFPPADLGVKSVLLPTDILDLMARTQTTVWLRPRSCVFTTSMRRGRLCSWSCENYRAVSLVHHIPPVIKKGFQKGHVQRCCTGGSAQQRRKGRRCDIRPSAQRLTMKCNNVLCEGENGRSPADPVVTLSRSDHLRSSFEGNWKWNQLHSRWFCSWVLWFGQSLTCWLTWTQQRKWDNYECRRPLCQLLCLTLPFSSITYTRVFTGSVRQRFNPPLLKAVAVKVKCAGPNWLSRPSSLYPQHWHLLRVDSMP